MENQARSDATLEGNATPSIATDIVAQLAAALRDIVNLGQRDSDLPRYDETYPAANFFKQYDDIADRAYLTGTKRLQKLPAQLLGEPLTFFRQLDLANKSYDQARQVLIDLYPGTVEVSFFKFLALKLTPQTTLQGYYREKTAMGLKLNLPTGIILESLTEGLPTADQRLVRTVSPNTLRDWHDLMARIKGSGVPAPVRPTPEPTSSRHDGHITLAREQPSRPYNTPPCFFSTPRLPRHADSSVSSQPPSPCHYCRGNHWNAQCPRRQPSGRNNVFYQETTGRQPRTSLSTTRSQPARSAPSSDTTVQTTPRSEEIGELSSHIDPYPPVEEARKIAIKRTLDRHAKEKLNYDSKYRTPQFEVGDIVLVKAYHHPNSGKELDAILEADPPKEEEKFKEWKKKDAQAKGILTCSMTDSLVALILTCKTSKEIWKALHARYEGDKRKIIIEARNDVSRLVMKREEKWEDYLNRAERPLEKARNLGADIEDEEFITSVTRGLPHKYNLIVLELSNQEKLTIFDLRNSLKLYHEKFSNDTKEINSSAFKVYSKDKYKHYKEMKTPKTYKCFICHKPGHKAAKCWHNPEN
ncbi:hypothetical protein LAZ67_2002980 [Cordylochernes scorpioides]|uniref:CCHC-type domain-containing protein n=1 Tax=Cordylochernes scorpioides TaxID=51811 RepID=A0ABY6K364_9ARAC|nr:hypothetical protein LAZ67_2002980 [Cordylochernes scorpioides]